MNDMDQLGELIGRGLAAQKATPVHVHVPEVQVSVDAAPLADAVRAGHDLNAKALQGVGGMFADAICKALADAVGDLAPSDLAGVETKLTALGDASGAGAAAIVAAISGLREELARNTAVSERLVAVMREQVAVMQRPKAVKYDDEGRIIMVGVA